MYGKYLDPDRIVSSRTSTGNTIFDVVKFRRDVDPSLVDEKATSDFSNSLANIVETELESSCSSTTTSTISQRVVQLQGMLAKYVPGYTYQEVNTGCEQQGFLTTNRSTTASEKEVRCTMHPETQLEKIPVLTSVEKKKLHPDLARAATTLYRIRRGTVTVCGCCLASLGIGRGKASPFLICPCGLHDAWLSDTDDDESDGQENQLHGDPAPAPALGVDEESEERDEPHCLVCAYCAGLVETPAKNSDRIIGSHWTRNGLDWMW